jgi:chaperone required for assembly of F1-ATPase
MAECDFLWSFDAPTASDPLTAARAALRKPLPKRFYSEVALCETAAGFAISLDGRELKTPGGRPFRATARAVAETAVAEWAAQNATIDPASMPMTRLINAAIDHVAARQADVSADILRYARSDLICYRADGPAALAERQARHWDPVLDWAVQRFGNRFAIGSGIIYISQPEEAVSAIARALGETCEPLRLAALHVATTLTGSCLLALALRERFLDSDAAWTAANLDEDFQMEAWGRDDEAVARREARRRDFNAAVMAMDGNLAAE